MLQLAGSSLTTGTALWTAATCSRRPAQAVLADHIAACSSLLTRLQQALKAGDAAGTNFLTRAVAFREAGWSPEYTLTEDYALGMELTRLKWQCRYVAEYLAIGEAPHETRNCFQQRSRWCKVHAPFCMCCAESSVSLRRRVSS